MKCRRCGKLAEVKLKSHHTGFCRECFLIYFQRQVKRAIDSFEMFSREDRILAAVSGGKDSLSLWNYLLEEGFDVTGLFVDLKIDRFSDKARSRVEKFTADKKARLITVDLEEEGIPLGEVIHHRRRSICSVCGQVKRYYFNHTAYQRGFKAVVTGHNLDDETTRLFANTLRWQKQYLENQGPVLPSESKLVKKVKPFYRLSEYEIAAYAYYKNIDYFAQECPFSKGATFKQYKSYINSLEDDFPGTKIDFYSKFVKFIKPSLKSSQKNKPVFHFCPDCGFPTVADKCVVCRLKEEIAQPQP